MNINEVSLKLVSSESGDWVVVYIDNILEREGHDINWISIIQEFKHFTGEIKSYEVSQEYMENGLPITFNDIEAEELVKLKQNKGVRINEM